jgi:hypothetical protein
MLSIDKFELEPPQKGTCQNFKIYGPRHPDGNHYAPIAEVWNECHARVMAAGPDTLQALEAIYKWWMTTPGFQDGDDDMPAELFDGMRDAIAKARGQQ